MQQVAIYAYQIGISFSIFILISLGLAVIFGMMRVINLAQGEFLMLGAYVGTYAAKQGLPQAEFRLGAIYERGTGIKKDRESAQRFYLAAAEAGNARAMHNLGVLYAEGMDGKPDYSNAAVWFRNAAEYGIADSQYNLGVIYALGMGIAADLGEAYKWFALAARGNDKDAVKKRDEVGARLDPSSLAAARAAVAAWSPKLEPESATTVKAPPGGWDDKVVR